jgi:hypothetical protein
MTTMEYPGLKAGRVLWRVFCTDVILYPQNNNTKETFRRVGIQHELMFVTWALMSEKSPFFVNKAYKLYYYISTTAQSWKLILAFEISISTGDVEQAAKDFAVLFRTKNNKSISFFGFSTLSVSSTTNSLIRWGN